METKLQLTTFTLQVQVIENSMKLQVMIKLSSCSQ